MKIHRFIGAFDLTQDRLVLEDTNLVHQMGRVLRLQVGERVALCDGNGQEVEGEIEAINKKSVTVEVKTRTQNLTESPHRVVLYLALIKRENFELAIQKATEVGVSEIVPISTQRTIKSTLNLERLQTIAREAAEQSGRGRVPVVHTPIAFAEACQRMKESGAEVFFFDVLSSRTQSDAVRDLAALPPSDRKGSRSLLSYDSTRDDKKEERHTGRLRRAAFIGPEGGWTPEEQALANEYKFTTVGLGSRILRAETAAIIASYLLSH